MGSRLTFRFWASLLCILRAAWLIALFAACSLAHADSFYKLIQYRCDHQANRVVVSYVGAWNEKGEQLVENKGSDSWEPFDLLELSGEQVTKLRHVTRQCRLSDGTYDIEIRPALYSTGSIVSRCAHLMADSAKVKISKQGKTVVSRRLEDPCSYKATPVVTEILVTGGAAEVKDMPGEDFRKW